MKLILASSFFIGCRRLAGSPGRKEEDGGGNIGGELGKGEEWVGGDYRKEKYLERKIGRKGRKAEKVTVGEGGAWKTWEKDKRRMEIKKKGKVCKEEDVKDEK